MGQERRDGEASLLRSEEELRIDTEREPAGSVSVRKDVETERYAADVPRAVEHLDGVERQTPDAGDSGEIEVLDDGSVSIPVFEEQLVVSRRMVVRERVIVRKVTETDVERIRADLARERVEVVGDRDAVTFDDEEEE